MTSDLDWRRTDRETALRVVRVDDELSSPVLREHAARSAVKHLRTALTFAKQAGAHRTADRIRLAITSAQGAVRHATNKAVRAESTDAHG